NKNMMTRIGIAILVILLAGAAYFYWQSTQETPMPEPLIGGEEPGVEIIEPVLAPDMSDMIRLTQPAANQMVSSPFVVQGQARGTWFFEASFPVWLYDESGNELALTIASTTEEWMTNDFVSFQAIVEFENPQTGIGSLVLENDNPSDLPENQYELRVPIRFAE
ncbi:Gmad2 immunoglobulin-like domain-containing protein, partial [Patescibacteria group bacterium]|nr:Gmad2 immunoglobulin-like domain-containing protein [Patescibacteria group bacterium]